MITANETQFAANIIFALMSALPWVDDPEPEVPDDVWEPISFFPRPLRANDPNQCIGVFPDLWQPEEDSFEMRGGPQGRHEPTLQTYFINLHVLVKDMEEARGLANHAELAERVRDMLYRNNALRLSLSELQATTKSGKVVRAMRWGVQNQKFVSNEFAGSWYYLATIRFYVEVENV